MMEPVRLRPAYDHIVGTTAFFRNRPLVSTVIGELKKLKASELTILFHSSSIGAEPYSFIISALNSGLSSKFALSCFATDLSQAFLDFAATGTYPVEVLKAMSSAESKYFSLGKNECVVKKLVRDKVRFLEASDIRSFSPERPFDVVFLMNALVYVTEAEQRRVFERISSYNTHFLVATGFHQETIRSDLECNGYEPVLTNIEDIHNNWTDRIRPEPILKANLPSNIYADWSLQPFAKESDWQYKSCAVFRKRNS